MKVDIKDLMDCYYDDSVKLDDPKIFTQPQAATEARAIPIVVSRNRGKKPLLVVAAFLLIVTVLIASPFVLTWTTGAHSMSEKTAPIKRMPAWKELNWKLDSTGLKLYLTDGTAVNAEYPLPDAFQQLSEKEYSLITSGISCITAEEQIIVFIPGLEFDGIVAISNDQGKTWLEQFVPGSGDISTSASSVGFTSSQRGWLLLQGTLGGGKAELYLFTTKDGGMTWHGNSIKEQVEPRQIDYITFISDQEGYLSVGAGWSGVCPNVYRTDDGGGTWTPCSLQTDVFEGYLSIQNLVQTEDGYIMTCAVIGGAGSTTVTLQSTSGLMWNEVKLR